MLAAVALALGRQCDEREAVVWVGMIYTVTEVLAQMVAIAVVAVGLYFLEERRKRRGL